MFQWLRDVYPQLSETQKPIEFLQESGDVVYLPAWWGHGTISVGDTLGYFKVPSSKLRESFNGKSTFVRQATIAWRLLSREVTLEYGIVQVRIQLVHYTTTLSRSTNTDQNGPTVLSNIADSPPHHNRRTDMTRMAQW